jgi:hypothetical protein
VRFARSRSKGPRPPAAESAPAKRVFDPALFLLLGWRRLRARPLQAVGLALAFGAAVALPAIGSVTGALSQEDNVALRLAEEPPSSRAFVVTSRLPPLGREPGEIDDVLAGFVRVSERVRRIRVVNPIAPSDERGVRLVVLENQAARDQLVLTEGRLPRPCEDERCEGLVVAGSIPERTLRLENGIRLRITGRAFISPRGLPDPDVLGERAVLVPRPEGPLASAVLDVGSGVVATSVLDPERVRAYEVPALEEAMRRAVVRVERLRSLDQASAPLALLGEMSERGRAARGRLLLVAAQAAALILAFAAFIATTRRRDTALLEEQLSTFGAGRFAALTARTVEVAVPAAAGAVLALAAVIAGTRIAAGRRGLPTEFVATALPTTTVLAVVLFAALAIAIVVSAGHSTEPRSQRIGALDVAALAAFGVTIWQAITTGALDPTAVSESGGGPVLLLLPALTLFVSAVILMRLLPVVFRFAERLARRSALTLRLALLSATRRPGLAAAATTFLAVALGTALFSLNYETTLTQQARDEASFRAAAAWRVSERPPSATEDLADVSPLTRYRNITQEAPTPVLRLRASLHEAEVTGGDSALTLVGLPAARLSDVAGWRSDFAPVARSELARRLQPRPVKLGGPALGRDATALRLWVQAQTLRPRGLVLHVLLPGQSFGRLSLGELPSRWERLEVELPPRLRGGQIVGLEFPALDASDVLDPGYVDFAALAARRGDGWQRLEPISDWVASPAPFGAGAAAQSQRFEEAPVARGIRFSINGSPITLLRPPIELSLRALVSSTLANAAVDHRLVLDVPALGASFPIEVVGEASLFPSVVESADAFAVVDYDALFASLNVDRPGAAPPSEAWFFQDQGPGFSAALAESPFRVREVVAAERLEERLLDDPLAAGARRVLVLGALAAALLAVLGLIVATRTALRDERTLVAEYEALGVPPRSLARSVQIRLVLLTVLGLVAGLLGGLLTVRLISALVAVTGSGARPIPPIRVAVDWSTSVVLVTVVGAAALVLAAWIAARELRSPAAGRLRA